MARIIAVSVLRSLEGKKVCLSVCSAVRGGWACGVPCPPLYREVGGHSEVGEGSFQKAREGGRDVGRDQTLLLGVETGFPMGCVTGVLGELREG